jgi:hypothetical protein
MVHPNGLLRRLTAKVAISSIFALAPIGANAAASVGGSINYSDAVFFDFSSSSNYTPGDVKAQILQGDYRGQPYAAQGYARADYGSLGISSFTASINAGIGTPIVRMDELVKSYFRDSITVTSHTQAVGTPVRLFVTNTIHVDESGFPNVPWIADYFGVPFPIGAHPCLPHGATSFLTGTCYYQGPNQPSAYLNAGFAVDGFQYADTGLDYVLYSALPKASEGTFGNGTSTFTFFKDVLVGQTVELNVRFEAVSGQYNPITYVQGFAGAAFFGLNTAHSYISLSDGANYVSSSGHDYTAPTIGAVPELTTWAMIIAGFGFVGAGLRRRSTGHKLQLV